MKKSPFVRLRVVTAFSAVTLFGFCNASAATYTANSGGGNWGDASIWLPVGGPPNSALDRADIRSPGTLTLANSSGVDASFTIYQLTVDNTANNSIIQNVAGGTGRLIFDNGGGNALILANKSGNRQLTINSAIQLNSNLEVFARGSVQINLSGPIVDGPNGPKNVTLRGANSSTSISVVTIGAGGVGSTYGGSTTVQGNADAAATSGGGKLRIAMDNALATTTVLTLEASNLATNAQGGRFDLNGFSQSVAGLSGASGTAAGLVTNNGVALPGTLSVNNSANFTFSGSIADGVSTVAFTKNGNGIQRLGGANAYTGATTVNAGSLLVGVSGVGSLGNTAVTVNAGTLGGTGSVAGTIAVGNGAGGADSFLAAGDGVGAIGTFTGLNTLSLASDSTFVFEYNGTLGTADQVVANGITIDSLSVFSFTDINPGTLANGTQFIVLNNTSGSAISGTFSNLADGSTFFSGANQFQVSYSGNTGNDLVFTVVPEPSAAMLLGASFATVLFFRRRNN